MNIRKATASFEKWLGRQTPLMAEQVQIKHQQMAAGLFPFLRATFYRWAQLWTEHAGKAADAPRVLGIGDVHIENFGTWRDAEGRLVWGVNDFDEAFTVPCTFDLVRLAASVMVARSSEGVSIAARDACEAILDGYTRAVRGGGQPFVLGEHHVWLSALAQNELRNPVSFWQRLRESPDAPGPLPPGAAQAIELLMPEKEMKYHVVQRIKGLGSLGHQRFIGLAKYHGGMIAREAKALSPSACVWAWDQEENSNVRYSDILTTAIRCPDPFVRVQGRWLCRRLAPDCSRIELSSLARVNDQARLLQSMGSEIANIHLGTHAAAKEILQDLKVRPKNWLRTLARKMTRATMQDWEDWKQFTEAADARP